MLRIEPITLPTQELPREPAGPARPDSLDTDAIIRFVRKRWPLCLTWLLFGLSAGMLNGVLSPGSYMAFADILLQHGVPGSTSVPPGGTDAANSTFIDTQVLVFQSDEVVGRVVDENQLIGDPEFGANQEGLRTLAVNSIRSLMGLGPAAAPEPRHATIIRVRRALTVRRVGMSDVVEIGFASRTPSRSAIIANAMIQSYVDSRRLLERQTREDLAAHLRERLVELRDKAFPVDQSPDSTTGAPASGKAERAHFRELQETTDTYRALYNRALQRAHGDPEAQFSSFDVQVITPATPPLLPTSRVMLVLVFAGCGGIAGFAHALFRELTDDRLATVEDVQNSSNLDCVIGVPQIDDRDWGVNDLLAGQLQHAYTRISPILLDALGKLAVRLQDGQNRRSGWIIGVVGLAEGTGVSSVAAHLGRIIAESGQKTLLVDANWRKPSDGAALLNTSEGRKLARRVATIELEAERLDILMLRATTPISELNAALSIVATLEPLRAEYDCIVADFHSFRTTADLAACQRLIDELIAVAAARQTTADDLDRFLRFLQVNRISAIIFNRTRPAG